MEAEIDLEDFQAEFEALDLTAKELAIRMQGWGDHREQATIVRSIQRMTAGETVISGEMKVIINMMLYQKHIEEKNNAEIVWTSFGNNSISAKAGEFTLSLSPQTKGRWHISIVHQDGYSHPWPSWQNSVEEAKRKALFCLSDARRHIFEYRREQGNAN